MRIGRRAEAVVLQAGLDITPDLRRNIMASITGTDGDDLLFGTPLFDFVELLDGDDVFFTRGGGDFVLGGSGNDSLRGEAGKNTLIGESGRDFCFGGDDNDLLDGGSGDDALAGDSGNDKLNGGLGPDLLRGGGPEATPSTSTSCRTAARLRGSEILSRTLSAALTRST
jgi:Ca2+-binding RTX toxin-like protein